MVCLPTATPKAGHSHSDAVSQFVEKWEERWTSLRECGGFWSVQSVAQTNRSDLFELGLNNPTHCETLLFDG